VKLIYWLSFVFLLLGEDPSYSQNRNSIWCFGDSAGIDFTTPTNPQPYYSAMRSRGTAVSIADSVGNLLFYAHTGDTSNAVSFQGNVRNKLHQLMENGDSLIGISWYQEMVIVPFPANLDKYYIFTNDGSVTYNTYYSIIDLSLNNGLGKVIQKNVPLVSNIRMGDCITTIKHANGRDWWLYMRSGDGFLADNPFYTFYINDQGIVLDTIQSFNPLTGGSFIEFRWNKQGTKMAFVNYSGLIQVFDYDRCTGLFSNPVTIDTMRVSPPLPAYWACEFSPNGRYLYITSHPVSSYLYVADLFDTTYTLNTIWSISSPQYYLSDLKRGPDDKIYTTGMYFDGLTFPYPYQDTVYNQYNMNLGVINYPDSGFSGCNYQPYSFYLGGKRTYAGLPNNPDYELGAWVGSPCDTLSVGMEDIQPPQQAWMQAWYNNSWQLIHVNSSKLQGKSGVLRILDIQGRLLSELELEEIHGGYFTDEINTKEFKTGLVIVQLLTEKEQLTQKVMIHSK